MEFEEPSSSTFVYMGWSVDLHRVGPFVLPSAKRQKILPGLRNVRSLLLDQGADHVRILETTFLPPLPGAPHFDVALLADGPGISVQMAEQLVESSGVSPAQWMTVAHDVARFGDTDRHPGPVLLNHFVGSASPAATVAAWRGISQWYRAILGVDNSTLLEPEPNSRFLVINYAGIPGSVSRFMLDQIARPSFYRSVIGPLTSIGSHACPLFARRIS